MPKVKPKPAPTPLTDSLAVMRKLAIEAQAQRARYVKHAQERATIPAATGALILGTRWTSWAPEVVYVPSDTKFPYHAYAVHKRGERDLEGRYVHQYDALINADGLAHMHALNHPRGLPKR